jgi:hypothetical protein
MPKIPLLAFLFPSVCHKMGYARIATCCCNPYPLYGNSMLSITPYHTDLFHPFFPLSFITGSMPENTSAYPYFQTSPYSKFLPH